MSAQIDLTVQQGSLEQRVFTVYSDAAGTVLRDISAYNKATLEVRKTYDASKPLLTLTESSGITLLSGSSQVVFTFLPSQTTPLKVTGEELDAVYQLEVYTDGDPDSTIRLAEGDFTLSREVVRS